MINRILSDKRLANKIAFDAPDKCWLWLGATTKGYGCLKRAYKTIYAHRYIYALVHGNLDENKLCLHACDNRLCVNPLHLYLGSHGDNMRDRSNRDPFSAATRRFYAGEILLMRRLFAGNISDVVVARAFKCSVSTVKNYVNKPQWAKEGYVI
jgi:hypothetical protein